MTKFAFVSSVAPKTRYSLNENKGFFHLLRRPQWTVPLATASKLPKPPNSSVSPTTDGASSHTLKTPTAAQLHATSLNHESAKPPNIPDDAVPYFAYFSNMNPRKIGPLSTIRSRRFPIIHSEHAILSSYRLKFSVPGLPPEPVFANLERDPSSEIYGIVHWLSPENFLKLQRSEGVPQSNASSSFLDPSWFPRVLDVSTTLPQSSRIVVARTVVFPALAPSWLKPSRRYVTVAMDGARHWGLDSDYIENVLGKISYEEGLLGGYGLFVEPKPHPLDRPSPDNSPKSSVRVPVSERNGPSNVSETSESEKHATTERPTQNKLYLIQGTKPDDSKRLLYYIPGLDGNGKAILRHVKGLEEDGIYNLKAFIYPFDNRETLESLVSDILDVIVRDAKGRPVSIVSESMGGALALMVGIENTRRTAAGHPSALTIDLLIASNPATSYGRSNPRSTWDFLLNFGFTESIYQTLLPAILVPLILDFGSPAERFSLRPFFRIVPMLSKVRTIADALPQAAMIHRLSILAGVRPTSEELASLGGPNGPKNVALMCSINDKLIPSLSESIRLRRAIPGVYYATLPFGGHSPMADHRFSLSGYLRPFSRTRPPLPPLLYARPSSNETILERRAAFRRQFEGKDQVIRVKKTRAEIRRVKEVIASSTVESAPVFIGEENIPQYDGKTPILFVSNHTLLGWLDGLLPMLRLNETRDVLLRIATHQILFEKGVDFFQGLQIPNWRGTGVGPEELKQFGMYEMSGRSLMEHLSVGHWCMLFPGGAKESLKSPTDEKYCLKWPEYPEFVRICALFGAIIIPVATVGTEDRVRPVIAPNVVEATVESIEKLTNSTDRMIPDDTVRAWRGEVRRASPPIVIPGRRDRIYYRFGKGIVVDEGCLTDKTKEKAVYEEVKSAVREGVRILLQRREHDMFRSVAARRRFAAAFGTDVNPPAGPGWAWAVGDDAYLDDELQPIL